VRWVALILAVVAIAARGSDAQAGCSPTLEWQDAGPRWSPDGSRLAFYRVLPGCNPAPVAVYVVPAEGGTPRQVSGATNGQWPPSWSADGRLLAVGGRRGIEVVNADGGHPPVEVTRGPDYAPSWSPSSAWIAFRRGPFPASELWIVQPNGIGPRKLLGGLHDHALPAWSPDSREIAVPAMNGITIDIHIVDVVTGAVRTVAPSPIHDPAPSWSRDGSTIAFRSGRANDPEIDVVQRDGSNWRRWITSRDPAFARDANALAYVRADGIWAETGPMGPTRLVARADVLGRIDWRPASGELPDFAFAAGGRCLRYGIYVVVDGVERRITNPCEFSGSGLVRGTPFSDFLRGSPGPDRLLGLGRKDHLDAGAGDDVLDGDGGWDTLLGRTGADVLIGGADPDSIVAGPGRDRVDAGAERDTISVRDGWRDMVDCGSGIDIVDADRLDVVDASCERVRR
jgi:dipeptidyl aminopeptidase/acylaminoacyl peptidase